MKPGNDKTLLALIVPILILFAVPVFGFGNEFPTDLTELSIEELMNVEVTLAEKKPRKLSQTAAAIFVITQEDIRRSGATSITEALRMVPGLDIAQIDSSKWAISARGFNNRYSNKLLVLIDGRSVYTPIFSGVFWECQDVFLEDIDRIEIIRGPGASLWGANAVNGIINIITKHTDETKGGLAYAGIGTEERVFGGARYGGGLGKETGFRVYAKYFDRDETRGWDEAGKSDHWDMFRAGFRTDARLSNGDEVTCQGDVHNGEISETSAIPTTEFPYFQVREEANRIFGGNAIGRWRHTYRDGSAIDLQIYYERTDKDESVSTVIGDIVDADFQHRFSFGIQDIVWGLGYRYHQDEVTSSEILKFDPSSREYQLCSAFLQDDVAFFQDRLRLTLGAKIEHNDFSGVEVQPGGRLLWTPSQSNVIWGAVAKAVGTPSRIYEDVEFIRHVYPPETTENPSPYPVSVNVKGNPDVVSEKLTAFELGHRFQFFHHFSLDTAVFYNIYKDMLTVSEEAPYLVERPGSSNVVAPIHVSNLMEGEAWGLEFVANWKPFTWWRLSPAYTYLHIDLTPEEGSSLYYSLLLEKTSPKHQVSVRSFADLPGNLELDVWLRYVDSISEGEVGEYTTLDARIGWQPVKSFEFSISGKNLLDSGHPEFIEQFIWGKPSEIERSVFGKATWRF